MRLFIMPGKSFHDIQTGSSSLRCPLFLLMQPARRVHDRRIQQRGENKDHIARQRDRQQRAPVIGAVKREQREQHGVEQLGNQRRAVVAQPEESAVVARALFGQLPPFVVQPHVEVLRDHIDRERGQHHARGVGEHRLHRRHDPVVRGRHIEQPGLRHDDEQDVRRDARPDRFLRFLFARDLA